MPIKEHILVFSIDAVANADYILQLVSGYIKSVEHELSLYPPSNIISNEKKEILRNLYESGINEDMIADQLDLDVSTVKMLMQEEH
jgi:DNA-binding NarL/FixJ family response regulator